VQGSRRAQTLIHVIRMSAVPDDRSKEIVSVRRGIQIVAYGCASAKLHIASRDASYLPLGCSDG